VPDDPDYNGGSNFCGDREIEGAAVIGETLLQLFNGQFLDLSGLE